MKTGIWTNVIDKGRTCSFVRFVFFGVIISLAISVLSHMLFWLSGVEDIYLSDSPSIIGRNLYLGFVTLVIFAPLIETVLFQWLPYIAMSAFTFFSRHKWMIIVFPALLFGLTHYYSLAYILSTSALGAFFMYAYMLRSEKGDSFLAVLAIHVTINLMVFITELWEMKVD